MNCANCEHNDGMVYTSFPPKYRCTITNEFHFGDDDCNVEFAPMEKKMTDKEALKVFSEISNFCNSWSWNSQTFANAIERARNALIESVKNGDFKAAPVKHGRWLNNTNGTFTCSVCGKRASRGNYCPNCGAKMDEVEE